MYKWVVAACYEWFLVTILHEFGLASYYCLIGSLANDVANHTSSYFVQVSRNEYESLPTFGVTRELILIVGPVAGGMIFVAIVGLAIFASMVKKKRSLHGTYSPQKQEYNAPRLELTEMMFKIPPEERLI